MARYEVEYALFRKCVIEADSLEEDCTKILYTCISIFVEYSGL